MPMHVCLMFACSLRKLLETVVTAPGVKVVSNTSSGVTVVAPGSQVTVNAQNGTSVKGPLTNVDVSQGKGIQVTAPGTVVDLKPDGRWGSLSVHILITYTNACVSYMRVTWGQILLHKTCKKPTQTQKAERAMARQTLCLFNYGWYALHQG